MVRFPEDSFKHIEDSEPNEVEEGEKGANISVPPEIGLSSSPASRLLWGEKTCQNHDVEQVAVPANVANITTERLKPNG